MSEDQEMNSPEDILEAAFKRASAHISSTLISDPKISRRIEYVSNCIDNRAVVRALLSSALAAVHNPNVDIRKPYTEIDGRAHADAYSGRNYDESYITGFINKHDLPCNPTTAYLTPAFRAKNIQLTTNVELGGRPKELYTEYLKLLEDIHAGKVTAKDVLVETVRCLIVLRDDKRQRIGSYLAELRRSKGSTPLSSEAIVNLIQKHLNCRGASRLPVLVVAAAYEAASKHLGERVVPMEAHTAADEQTGRLGDLDITLIDDDKVVTSYEMKLKRVTIDDIDRALHKIKSSLQRIDNYIFVTTDVIEEAVTRYAAGMYEKTGGMEFVILDCISFLRHFLHLFHRLRVQFLDIYQRLVLEEPESAVGQPLKEAFLALRIADESGK